MALRLLKTMIAAAATLACASAVFADAPAVDFLREVKPILAQRCFRCHSSLEQEGNLRLDSAGAILKGGEGGQIIVPGKSRESRLIAAVERRGDLKMPPEGEPLSQKQIDILKAWIDAGAPAPPPGAEAKVDHWSFKKPERPALPRTADSALSANPIDAFIAAKHAELNLTPIGEAPGNLLLRRLHLDLIGLPPTVEELQTNEPYEAVVDRLLASPQYGERWGRHWMDVWRYSDWDGYKQEIRESQPHIWRWRDWIVESLNADKPYDQMVREMLAGDEIAPTDPDTLRATGYLVRSWYKFNRNKWLDDAIEHTGKAFLGLTFNCCRCHDHMYDPLPQRDYYSLRAFFEPYEIRTDPVPGEADTAKSGLVRVFDAKADAQTFVFIRGNEKDPLKDQAPPLTAPALLGAISCGVESRSLPQTASYPGLAQHVRDAVFTAANQELEKAKSALAEAEAKFASASKLPPEAAPAGDKPKAPDPPAAIREADNQLALARSRAAVAETNLVFNELRVLADDAKFATPPAASAMALAAAAGHAERELNLRQTEKSLLEARVKLAALDAPLKARATAVLAFDKPAIDYTGFTPTYPATSTGRRLALAGWITSKDNPLAARVAINHIWLRHFGSPLVPTVFDFGMNGKPPTNQPLLDWLAAELIENGWRMKHIHKLIVTSRTYRLASSVGMTNDQAPMTKQFQNPKSKIQNSSIDPENKYYWRANVRRMEAETVRDSVLFLAGTLDLSRGGPDLDPNLGLTNPRRSLYFRNTKEKKVEFLSLFDSPNPVECYRRSESIAPQQALAMANSTLSLDQSRILAKKLSGLRVATSEYDAPRRFVEDAFVRILCRHATDEELTTCVQFLSEQAGKLGEAKSLTAFGTGPKAEVPPSIDPVQRARENLVHVLFNHNDFVTIR